MKREIGMADGRAKDFSDAFASFMKQYFLFINPILHRGSYRGRRFTENEIIVLLAVSVQGSMTPGEITAVFNLQKGSLTTVVRGLVDEGYIAREAVPRDARSYRIRLTDIGEAIVDLIARRREGEFDKLFDRMPRGDLEAATAGIEALTGYLRTREPEL